jgi:hypothetical protein
LSTPAHGVYVIAVLVQRFVVLLQCALVVTVFEQIIAFQISQVAGIARRDHGIVNTPTNPRQREH